MPAKGFTKPEPLSTRIKVGLSDDVAGRLDAKAAAASMTVARYVRSLIEHDLGDRQSKPTVARNHATMLLLAEVHTLAMQIKKLGTNVNQIAHQVNAGVVPVTTAEMVVTQSKSLLPWIRRSPSSRR
ncbi:MAG: plasmid mobilization relaxosome protein MobC [Nitrospiraceae bacterium]